MIKSAFKSLAIACLALFPAALPAQEVVADDPHRALALAVSSDEIAILRFEQDMKVSFETGIKQIPEMAQLDQDCPGFILGFGKVMRGPVYEGHMDDNIWYRGKLEELFRARLSKEDAAGAARFYGSEQGQNLLAQAIASMTAENTVAEVLEDIDEDRPLSAEAYNADQVATASRLLKKLSPEEMASLNAALSQAKWFPKVMAIMPEVQALGLELFNRDYSPELNAKIEAVAENFTNEHLKACEAP